MIHVAIIYYLGCNVIEILFYFQILVTKLCIYTEYLKEKNVST